jgi:hypothetical protein
MKKKISWFMLCCLVPVLTLALFLGCENNDEIGHETLIEVPEAGAQVYRVSDTSNYSGSGTVTVTITDTVSLDLGTITDGKLTLKLPETVKEEYLEPVTKVLGPSLTISSQDAKILTSEFAFVDNTKTSYRLSYEKDSDNTEDCIFYIYSSKGVIVSGTETRKEEKKTYIETYDLALTEGWNRVFWHEERHEDGTRISTITTDGSGMPLDMKWMLHDN